MVCSNEIVRLCNAVVEVSPPEVLGVAQLSSEKERTYLAWCWTDSLPCIPEDFRCKDCGCNGDCNCDSHTKCGLKPF